MDELNVIRVPCGMIETNAYILFQDGRTDAVLVDPADGDAIQAQLDESGLACAAILLTHGHFDHITGLSALRSNCPVLIGAKDAGMLGDPQKNGSFLVPGLRVVEEPAERALQGGEEFELAGIPFLAIPSPGHTQGGMSYLTDGALFAGDTLFRRSIGRTDLPGGDMDELASTILALYELPQDTIVFPGHGEATTIGEEAANNPYVRKADTKRK